MSVYLGVFEEAGYTARLAKSDKTFPGDIEKKTNQLSYANI